MAGKSGSKRPLTDKERAGIDAENRGRPVANPSQVPKGNTRDVARTLRDRGRDIDSITEDMVKRR